MWKIFSKKRLSNRGSPKRPGRLVIDRLETRRVPSAAALVGSELVVTGTKYDDVIDVRVVFPPRDLLHPQAIDALGPAAVGNRTTPASYEPTDSLAPPVNAPASDEFVGPVKPTDSYGRPNDGKPIAAEQASAPRLAANSDVKPTPTKFDAHAQKVVQTGLPAAVPVPPEAGRRPIMPAPYAAVFADGKEIGRFDLYTFHSIRVNGFAGNDRITVDAQVERPVYLDGGDGHDVLALEEGKSPESKDGTAARLVRPWASAVMLGGEGDDILVGGSGFDILIGGNGWDIARGMGGEDVLIGGGTLADDSPKMLLSLLSLWNGDGDYEERVDAFRAAAGAMILPDMDATFAYSDGDGDVLLGGDGLDWFLGAGNDNLPDLSKGEFVDG